MGCVSGEGDGLGRWAAGLQRAATAPYAPAITGVLLAVFAVAQAIAAPVSTRGADAGPLQLAFVLLALATTLPLGLLWTHPAAAAVAVCAACVLSLWAFHVLLVAGLIALLILLYRLGRNGSQVLAALLALPFLVLALAGHAGPGARVPAVLLAALGPAAAWAGAARRARCEAMEHSAARAVIAGSLLEHTVRGERARVSRELHDVVAHHISMIAVQAETARLTTAGMPAAGARQLTAIGDTARAALTEMRRLLGVLREDTRTGAAVRRPQPTLLQLNELLDEARDASGSGIRLIVHGPMTALDPGIELAAYRIVQEALTNARRHAEGAAVDVELHYTAGALRLRVRDNGPGPPPTPGPAAATAPPLGGHGLLGMRERAAAVGGDLRTGAATGGGFLVEATLPTAAEAAA
jgi:signal transduction histidine kinase